VLELAGYDRLCPGPEKNVDQVVVLDTYLVLVKIDYELQYCREEMIYTYILLHDYVSASCLQV
jgi:hypothetical protein